MIGIVFIGDIKYCPYLIKYVREIETLNEKYEVLFWAREDYLNEYPDNYHAFRMESDLLKPFYSKLKDFYKYRKWLSKKLKEQNYSKIIVLSTLSGIIIFDLLIKKYKKKYIFDIRDYSYEHNKVFYYLEEKLIKNSSFTSISSEGFKAFLPSKGNYQLVHNINSSEIAFQNNFTKVQPNVTLNVVWIGSIRYFDHQRKIIDHLKNDTRYKMIFHGTGPEYNRFVDYCTENKINNVLFTGQYNNKDKNKLLENAHILNNSYNSPKTMEIKYAISNKFYDGIIFGIPQLVETNSYKFEIVTKESLGFGIDVNNKDFSDILYENYFSLSEEVFNCNKRGLLEKIIEEDKQYIQKISNFIKIK